MGRIFGVIVAGAAVLALVGAASAQMGGGMRGSGMGGMMGGGLMGGDAGKGAAPQITADQAQKVATEYAAQYLPGFTVTATLPATDMHMTMYQAELSGPNGETRILHINPWGAVMPFGGPATR